MSDLRKLLSEADRVQAPDLWPEIRQRRPRPLSRSRQVVAGAVALALAASGIAVVSLAFLGDRERPPAPRNAAGMEVDPRITAEVLVGDFPQEVAVGEGAVWVTVSQAAPSVRWYVARIDPATNQVTDEIDVPGASDIAVGDGAVWVAGYPARDPEVDPVLYRIDPSSREVVAEITLPCAPYCGIHQVALGKDALWITLANTPESGEVVRVDPRTDEIVARIAVPGDPRDLVVAQGSVWVYALGQGGALHRIDARSNELAATLLQGRIYSSSGVNSPPILALGFGYVWIEVGDGDPMEVARIDPETGEIAGDPVQLALDEALFQPFSTEAGGVWFRGDQQGNRPLIGRLNPLTLKVDETLRLDSTVIHDGTIDPESGTMWLTNLRRSVTRIDLRPDPGQVTAVDPRVTAEIAVGQFPQEVAVGEGAVWVTVNDADAPERWFVARIDPATNRVTDEIDLRDAVDIAVGAGSVWAITYDGATGWAVARIDPALRTITGVIPLDCHRGCGATQVAATDDAVWVTSSPDYPERGEVVRIDPLTNQVVARIGVTGDPRDLAVGEGGVWVYALTHFAHGAVAGGTVYRIDPATNSLSVTLLEGQVPPVAGISGPSVLTVGHGYVWTIRMVGEGPDEELVRIDPRTNQVEGLTMLGYFHPFAVGDGGVWLRSSRQEGSVLPVGISRLNSQTLRLDESVGIDGLPVDAALDPGAGVIWLATYQGPVIRIDLR